MHHGDSIGRWYRYPLFHTIVQWIRVDACGLIASIMTRLARFSVGRILLHLLAMLGDRCVRFHVAGIARELAFVVPARALLARARTRLIDALVLYLARPIKRAGPQPGADPQSLAAVLDCGDVLLSHANTRVAALVKRITQSPWSHVSMYVGPLEEGPDPLCIVEADMVAGVRSIRLSELNALQVRVLRPIGLGETDRSRLADWVVSRIGSEYDLTHAWGLGRKLLRLPLPSRLRSSPGPIAYSATRFICCSLLAHAFVTVGFAILPDLVTPGDFERASVFETIT